MSDVTANASKHKWSADELAARFQKIETRWEKRKRRGKHFTLSWRRRRELQIIVQHRYPDGVPAHIDIDELVWVDAQTLGDSFALTAEERTMWKITTIRAFDQNAEQAATARKAKKRDAERRRRLCLGAKPHALSKSRSQPWLTEGISRSTHYRRMAQIRGVTQIRGDHLSLTSKCLPRNCPTPDWVDSDEPASSLRPDSWPALPALGYLIKLAEYRRLTSGGYVKAVPGLAACSELRRMAA